MRWCKISLLLVTGIFGASDTLVARKETLKTFNASEHKLTTSPTNKLNKHQPLLDALSRLRQTTLDDGTAMNCKPSYADSAPAKALLAADKSSEIAVVRDETSKTLVAAVETNDSFLALSPANNTLLAADEARESSIGSAMPEHDFLSSASLGDSFKLAPTGKGRFSRSRVAVDGNLILLLLMIIIMLLVCVTVYMASLPSRAKAHFVESAADGLRQSSVDSMHSEVWQESLEFSSGCGSSASEPDYDVRDEDEEGSASMAPAMTTLVEASETMECRGWESSVCRDLDEDGSRFNAKKQEKADRLKAFSEEVIHEDSCEESEEVTQKLSKRLSGIVENSRDRSEMESKDDAENVEDDAASDGHVSDGSTIFRIVEH